MTTPAFDQLTFKKGERYKYEIIGNAFNPKDYGFTPKQFGSHCWKGFICFYEVLNKQLYLRHLIILSDSYPILNGIEAKPANPAYQYRGSGYFIIEQPLGYFDLNLKLDFTGTMEAGDFSSLFEPPYKQEKPDYLFFEKGVLQKIKKTRKSPSFFLRKLKRFLISQL